MDSLQDNWPKTYNVIQGSRNSWGDDMGAFLCFMAVRLIEMHRLLKDTGSIYLHCDPTASHYLKELMDAIFDGENFRNEIVWCYTDPLGEGTLTTTSKRTTLCSGTPKSIRNVELTVSIWPPWLNQR